MKTTNIADGADLWLDLEIPPNLIKKEQDCYVNRKEMALRDLVLAAFYIDPYKDKTKLSSSQRSKARLYISSRLPGNTVDELLAYESGNIFPQEMLAKITNPKDFWTFAEPLFPNLGKMALRLLSIPASTAQLERVFSMWQHIHSRLRNRLTFENSKKLMHIYYYLHTENITQWESEF